MLIRQIQGSKKEKRDKSKIEMPSSSMTAVLVMVDYYLLTASVSIFQRAGTYRGTYIIEPFIESRPIFEFLVGFLIGRSASEGLEAMVTS